MAWRAKATASQIAATGRLVAASKLEKDIRLLKTEITTRRTSGQNCCERLGAASRWIISTSCRSRRVSSPMGPPQLPRQPMHPTFTAQSSLGEKEQGAPSATKLWRTHLPLPVAIGWLGWDCPYSIAFIVSRAIRARPWTCFVRASASAEHGLCCTDTVVASFLRVLGQMFAVTIAGNLSCRSSFIPRPASHSPSAASGDELAGL